MAEIREHLFPLFRELAPLSDESACKRHGAEIMLLPHLKSLETKLESEGKYELVLFLNSPLFTDNLAIMRAFIEEALKKLAHAECNGAHIIKALKAYLFELVCYTELHDTLSPNEVILPPKQTAHMYDCRRLRSRPPAKRAVPDGLIFMPTKTGHTLLTAVCDYKAHWHFDLPEKQTFHYRHMWVVSDLFDNFNPVWVDYLELILGMEYENLPPSLGFDAHLFRTIFCIPEECVVNEDIRHLVVAKHDNTIGATNSINIVRMGTSLSDLDRIAKSLIFDFRPRDN